MGSKESGLKVLKKIYALVGEKLVGCVTIDDTKDDRSELCKFQIFCEESGIHLDIVSGKCDLTSAVQKFRPDICFVMGWYHIISEDLLDAVPGGFIGIHNSLLPRHRGFAPVVWSMIAGEKETGFSVFSFDKGMDTGNIWYQKKVTIEERDHIRDVLKKIDEEIDVFFDLHFESLLAGRITPQKQSRDNVTYGARRTAADGKIDWHKNAKEIYDFIRAQSKPYPGAFSTYRQQIVRIWRAEIFPYTIQGSPGQVGIIDYDRGEVVIVCGNNTGLALHEVEVSGDMVPATYLIKGLNNSME